MQISRAIHKLQEQNNSIRELAGISQEAKFNTSYTRGEQKAAVEDLATSCQKNTHKKAKF